MFEMIGSRSCIFDDFRVNGLLLPSTESAALAVGMPLHRGPHPTYNGIVIARVGRIEASWSKSRLRDPLKAARESRYRLSLLQTALRRRLLDERRRMVLNNKDPLGTGFDFTELDAMAEQLWAAT